jgi:predicted transcriptional regulator of viral defense system
MHDPPKGPDHELLYEVASEQGGYFTAAQALDKGFSRALLAHHASAGGRFIRIQPGLYRFRQYPPSPREEVLAAWLGVDRDSAVVSHESALDLLGLSDVVPEVIHLTVPRSKRYLPAGSGVALHTTTREFDEGDVVVREGIKVTSPRRSILDAAEGGTAPEQIVTAVGEAIRRGMTTRSRLLTAARERNRRVEALIRRALKEGAKR